MSFQNRDRFAGLLEQSRSAVATQLGASADEIALVRNTCEANNIIVAGLDLGAGDEVLLWDQNHPSNQVAWTVRAVRSGFSVRSVAVTGDPASVDDLLASFLAAYRRRPIENIQSWLGPQGDGPVPLPRDAAGSAPPIVRRTRSPSPETTCGPRE